MRQTYAVLVVLVVAGCPPVETPTSDASVPGDPVEAYCRSLSREQCEWERRCGTRSTEVPCPEPTIDCAEWYRPLLDAGVARFSASAASSCLSQWADAGCALDPSSLAGGFGPVVCRAVLGGNAGFGEPCGLCEPGLVCQPGSGACGACVIDSSFSRRLPREGEPCQSPIADGPGCAGGFSCTGWDGGLVCEPMLEAGAKCEGKVCRLGLVCQSAEGGSTCQPARELGAPCDPGHVCKSGLACLGGSCAPLKEMGAPCADFTECQSQRCLENVCAAAVAQLGEACESTRCASGLFCREADSVCALRAPAGAACAEVEACLFGLQCLDGTCRSSALECR